MDSQLNKIKKDLAFSSDKVANTLQNFGYLKMEDVKEVKSDDQSQPSFHSSNEDFVEPVDNDFIRDKLDQENEKIHKKTTNFVGRIE